MIEDAAFWGLACLVASPFLGSFFALLADRLPQGEPVLAGRSICRHCGRTLGPVDLVPVLSYIALRGKCRTCDGTIGREAVLFEAGALLLALQAVFTVGWGWLSFVTLILGLALLTLAVIDSRHYYLPDVLTLPLIVLGLATSVIEPRLDPVAAAAGAFLGYGSFAFIAWLYHRLRGQDGLGLGDAKLYAAAGAFVGWQGLPLVLLVACCFALAHLLGMRLRGRIVGGQDAIPFGPYLALGIWLIWLYAPPLI